jgi:5-methylcytosine-specific restriction endonuclease McrA
VSRGWTDTRRTFPGGNRNYAKLRRAVLERDGHRCQVQTEKCTTVADCVHHTIGVGVSGHDPDHMVASCTECNLHVGDPRKLDPEPRVGTWW